MPKKQPEPFWRTQTNCWYVQIGKKQVRLDPDEATARRLYHELMSKPPEERVPEPRHTPRLAVEIMDAFLEWVQRNQSEKTYRWYRDNIQRFADSLPPGIEVSDLKPWHATRVMDAADTWSASTRHGFARCVKRPFAWAVEQGLIDENPMQRLKKPRPEAREEVLTTAEFEALLAMFPDRPFRDLLVTAWETGCRPGELFDVEARHVDPDGGRWVFPASESKGKRSKRVVYLSEKALDITRRLVAAHPTGPLFRNADGGQWTKDQTNCRFRRKVKKFGRKVSLYMIRHSFCQRLLLAGVDSLQVALLMGHSSPDMVHRHYQHLQREPEFLRRALSGGRGGASA